MSTNSCPKCCCCPCCCSRPIPGPQGPQGATGSTGATGATGATGETGPAAALNIAKSLSAISTITVPSGTEIPFLINQVYVGSAITHATGSPDFVLTQAGTYQVLFDTSAFVIASTALPFEAIITLNVNGTPTVASQATINNYSSNTILSGAAVVAVNTFPTTITLVNASTDSVSFLPVSIIIHKLD